MYILTTVLYCVCVGRAAAKTTLNPRALSASAGNRWFTLRIILVYLSSIIPCVICGYSKRYIQ